MLATTINYYIYRCSQAGLNTIQRFLDRCYRRITEPVNIRDLLKKLEKIFFKTPKTKESLLYKFSARKEEYEITFGTNTNYPSLGTDRFKTSFVNRLIFRYNTYID